MGSLDRRTICRWVLALSFGLTSGALLVQADESPVAVREQARQILAESGVRGGLIVHLGCGDGRLTAALRPNDSYLVQGLDADPEDVSDARAHIRSLGLYGPVSADQWDGEHLPYVGNLVNLVVAEEAGRVTEAEMLRVLAPPGVACMREGEGWTKTVKPRPEEMDEWTHFLHGPDNNAVAHDTLVGPPQRLQWLAGPTYARHHEHKGAVSVNALVSSGGRVFAIEDEGPAVSIFLPPKWSLVARDAMNGVLLWRRALPASHPLLSIVRSASRPQTLVAVGEHVYVALGLGEPVCDLDAATGKTLRTYEETRGAEQIVCRDGRLFVVARSSGPEAPKELLAIEADTGRVLWEKSGEETVGVLPLSLAVDGTRLFLQNPKSVVCLDVVDGEERWRYARAVPSQLRAQGPATLVASDGVVLSASRTGDATPQSPTCELVALSAETGTLLWSRPCAEGWGSPVDVFVIDGLAWFGSKPGRGSKSSQPEGEADLTEGLDLRTGEVKRRLDTELAFVNRPHHHRCHREKATDRYLVVGRHGVEMVPLQGGDTMLHDWVRGGCGYGVMPCNGLLYVPPHPCRCHIGGLLTGFFALAPAAVSARPGAGPQEDDAGRHEPGPAYDSAADREYGPGDPESDEWATYRHDPARSGYTGRAVPLPLTEVWRNELGGRLTSVVVAEGRLLVADVDAHTVYGIDSESGETLWSYTAGGRVDSPPTVHRGRVLFGSADGWVYCLRAADGQLAWRFRAGPEEKRIVVGDQLESLWPVHGAVLAVDGVAHVVAGRSPHLSGGLVVHHLDAATGRVLETTQLDRPAPGEAGVEGLPDILSSDEQFAYMRLREFPLASTVGTRSGAEPPHLICPTGMLDDSWWHRTHWVFGKGSDVRDPITVGTRAPAGQVLVFDDAAVYGYGRKPEYFMWTSPVEYRLFAADRTPEILPMEPPEPQPPEGWLRAPERRFATRWSRDVALHVRAMVLAGNKLLVAGPPNVAPEGPPERFSRTNRLTAAEAQAALDAWEGRSGALLWAVSKSDGTKLAEYELDSPPVFDGMAAAGGRLYVSTMGGQVVCLGQEE